MPSPNIKQILSTRKNPQGAVIAMLTEAQKTTQTLVEKALAEAIQEIKTTYEQKSQELFENCEAEITKLTSFIPKFKEEAEKKIEDHIKQRSIEIRGEDGYTPIKNLDYFDGAPGRNGKDADPADVAEIVLKKLPIPENGKDGKDGSSDTAEQVVEKVNKAKTKVDLQAVAGLPQELSGLKKALREKGGGGGGGGGGMGSWVHERFDTSSATTTVSLANNVAANGTALLLRYNGQLLFHGRQYTLSGKVATFTFTLDNDSEVDATYVRK